MAEQTKKYDKKYDGLLIHGLSTKRGETIFSLNLAEHFIFHESALIGIVQIHLKKGIFFSKNENLIRCRAVFPECDFKYGGMPSGLTVKSWDGDSLFEKTI